MRGTPIRSRWEAAGATFRERAGVEVVARAAASAEAEYRAIREAVGLTDFSFLRCYRLPEERGIDYLDGKLAGNVAKIRFGRVLHTFLAGTDGLLAADVYVANNDQEFLVFCESIVPDGELESLLAPGASEAGLEDLSASHVVLSLDGFKAWAVAKKLFGPDVLGLPYLSIETYPFEGIPIRLVRAGKTSEFGYLLLTPVAAAGQLFDVLRGEVMALEGQLCGADIHDDLRLEGRFFNIHAEGVRVGDPLALGLQWMIDLEKPSFLGSEPILQRRAAGLQRKIVGVSLEPGSERLAVGGRVFLESEAIGEVVAAAYSHELGRWLGLALLPVAWAYAGLHYRLGSAGGPDLQTISMPPIFPKSLGVKLDEM